MRSNPDKKEEVEKRIFEETTSSASVQAQSAAAVQNPVLPSPQQSKSLTKQDVARMLVKLNAELPVAVKAKPTLPTINNQAQNLSLANDQGLVSSEEPKKKRRRKRGKKKKAEI